MSEEKVYYVGSTSLGLWSGPHETLSLAVLSANRAERQGQRVRIWDEPKAAVHYRVYDADGACLHHAHPAGQPGGEAAARDAAERVGLHPVRVEVS